MSNMSNIQFLPSREQVTAVARYCVNLVLHKATNPKRSKVLSIFLNVRDAHVKKLTQSYPNWQKTLFIALTNDIFNDTRKNPKKVINFSYIIESAKKVNLPEGLFLPLHDVSITFAENGEIIVNEKRMSIEDMRFAHHQSTVDRSISLRARY